jgi:Domain of unknown function (DUF1844)
MPMSETDFPLPPPTFEFLIFSLKMQAEMRLGLLSAGAPGDNPEDNEEPDLPAARHAIDMLAMLADKTRGNLSLEEQRLIENSLTELRFRFVQVSESTAKQRADAAHIGESQGEAPASS